MCECRPHVFRCCGARLGILVLIQQGRLQALVTSLILVLGCELEHPPEESTRNLLLSLQVGGHMTGLAGKSVFGYF